MIISKTNAVDNSNTQDPPSDQQQALINLYGQVSIKSFIRGFTIITKVSKSVVLFNIIGATNKGLGKLDEAIEAYKKAITIKPDYAEAHYNMGIALTDKGKLDEALEACKKAISIKPDYTSP